MTGCMRLRTFLLRLVLAGVAAGALAGCDKCGNRVKFNAPSLPASCGENANPAR